MEQQLTLTKQEKAVYFAHLLDTGYGDYFDYCDYKPYGKWAYRNSQADRTEYYSTKQMAELYDREDKERDVGILEDLVGDCFRAMPESEQLGNRRVSPDDIHAYIAHLAEEFGFPLKQAKKGGND